MPQSVPHRRAVSTPPSLLSELWSLLQAHRPAVPQERSLHRMQALVLGCLFSFARRTVTQALVALGLTDCDWSAFYRLFNEPRVSYEELTTCCFAETLDHVPDAEPYVTVVDGVQIPRHSHKMPGTSWLKHPKTHRSCLVLTAPSVFYTLRPPYPRVKKGTVGCCL